MPTSRRQHVFRIFRETVRGFRMIEAGDRVLAACSGGPDSVALVTLLLELKEEMPFEIIVAHFNHRLREAAGGDEAFVRGLSRRWGLPFARGAADVGGFAKKKGLNLEEAGRSLRYAFLRKTALRLHASKIATGHTLNDQAETVLMRLLRGTGLAGLGGIEPMLKEGPVAVIRPLLGIGREDIEAFLAERGLPSRTDASNLDPRYLRNRIRARLLPLLETEFEPRVVRHLARLAELARADEELLQDFVRELAEEFVSGSGRDASLDMRTLALAPSGLARRVVREFLLGIKGDLRSVSSDDVERVLGLRDGKETTVRKSLTLERRNGRVELKRPAARRGAFELSWSGKTPLAIKGTGITLMGQVSDRPAFPIVGDDRTEAFFDLDKLEFPLLIRNRRTGDQYRPLGSPGRKKLKEILRARGIARDDRDRLPVVLSGGEVVWMPGLPVAERFKVGAATKRLFAIFLARTIHKTPGF